MYERTKTNSRRVPSFLTTNLIIIPTLQTEWLRATNPFPVGRRPRYSFPRGALRPWVKQGVLNRLKASHQRLDQAACRQVKGTGDEARGRLIMTSSSESGDGCLLLPVTTRGASVSSGFLSTGSITFSSSFSNTVLFQRLAKSKRLRVRFRLVINRRLRISSFLMSGTVNSTPE